ncbi:hypothetical protein FRB99_001276 [Tulasnella sp. 403]|nr:hypothetical protein FRB99_001276 [Tulasnella sp. 403]
MLVRICAPPGTTNITGTITLPRRLFRRLKQTPEDMENVPEDDNVELIRFFLESESIDVYESRTEESGANSRSVLKRVSFGPADPNSYRGYGLAKAVRVKHMPMISLLLTHGADPTCGGGMPMKLAIALRDMDLAKLLLRHLPPSTPAMIKQALLAYAIKCDARDIAQYLREHHGFVPTMSSLRTLAG